ncbi:MAG: rhodanese-like domain-containing protein, partial [Chloroflexota bacterium]
MSKKFQMFLALFLALSMVLGACGAPATAEPVAEATEAVVEAVVTEAPVVETGPDVLALFTDLAANLPADKGFGTVKVTALKEELVDNAPFILDVREASELETDGYIEGSINIPVRDVLNNLDKLPGLDEPIVVTCASGHRGGMVMAALKMLGYTNVRNLGGGIGAWKKAELPLVTGSLPEAPAAISTPIIADQPLFDMLNDFFVNLPEGFYTIKSDKLAEELTGAE